MKKILEQYKKEIKLACLIVIALGFLVFFLLGTDLNVAFNYALD